MSTGAIEVPVNTMLAKRLTNYIPSSPSDGDSYSMGDDDGTVDGPDHYNHCRWERPQSRNVPVLGMRQSSWWLEPSVPRFTADQTVGEAVKTLCVQFGLRVGYVPYPLGKQERSGC